MLENWPKDWPESWKKRRKLPNRAAYRATLGLPAKGICLWCRAPSKHAICSHECRREFSFRATPFYLRKKILERDGGKCALCGVVSTNWHADHIIPVSYGGGCCGPENIRTLCPECHEGRTAAIIQYSEPGTPGTDLWRDGTQWTREDDNTLKAAHAKGFGLHKISEILGRTQDSVKSRLRIIEPRKGKFDLAARERSLAAKPWTEEEDEALRRGCATTTWIDLANKLGRTTKATHRRAQILGLVTPNYTSAEKRQILAWVDGGRTTDEIAEQMGRSASSLKTLVRIWTRGQA